MNEINTLYANLPTTIPAYVVENNDMSYTIVLNSRLSHEKIYFHTGTKYDISKSMILRKRIYKK